MIDLRQLPLVHSVLNSIVAALLVLGFLAIRRGQRARHRALMLGASVLSALFLVSYVVYHARHGSTKFLGQGAWRPVYFAVLISHTVLATLNLPFVIATLARGWRGDFPAHKRLAKRTWAVWLYVAVTGPLVYLLLRTVGGDGGQAAMEEALRLHQAGQDAAALARYREAAAQGSRGARCFASVLGDRLEGTATASLTLSRALAEDPSDRHCRVLQGRELAYRGQHPQALALLTALTAEHPTEAFYFASLGMARFRAEVYLEAAEAFARAFELDPQAHVDAFNAGYAYYLGGRYKEAEAWLERALAAGLPDEPRATAAESLDIIRGALWLCPMHPEVTGKKGETCGKCGMKLEPASHGLGED